MAEHTGTVESWDDCMLRHKKILDKINGMDSKLKMARLQSHHQLLNHDGGSNLMLMRHKLVSEPSSPAGANAIWLEKIPLHYENLPGAARTSSVVVDDSIDAMDSATDSAIEVKIDDDEEINNISAISMASAKSIASLEGPWPTKGIDESNYHESDQDSKSSPSPRFVAPVMFGPDGMPLPSSDTVEFANIVNHHRNVPGQTQQRRGRVKVVPKNKYSNGNIQGGEITTPIQVTHETHGQGLVVSFKHAWVKVKFATQTVNCRKSELNFLDDNNNNNKNNKNSLNKDIDTKQSQEVKKELAEDFVEDVMNQYAPTPPQKRKRGRPKGSKNRNPLGGMKNPNIDYDFISENRFPSSPRPLSPSNTTRITPSKILPVGEKRSRVKADRLGVIEHELKDEDIYDEDEMEKKKKRGKRRDKKRRLDYSQVDGISDASITSSDDDGDDSDSSDAEGYVPVRKPSPTRELSEYEKLRAARIARNEKRLEDLGLLKKEREREGENPSEIFPKPRRKKNDDESFGSDDLDEEEEEEEDELEVNDDVKDDEEDDDEDGDDNDDGRLGTKRQKISTSSHPPTHSLPRVTQFVPKKEWKRNFGIDHGPTHPLPLGENVPSTETAMSPNKKQKIAEEVAAQAKAFGFDLTGGKAAKERDIKLQQPISLIEQLIVECGDTKKKVSWRACKECWACCSLECGVCEGCVKNREFTARGKVPLYKCERRKCVRPIPPDDVAAFGNVDKILITEEDVVEATKKADADAGIAVVRDKVRGEADDFVNEAEEEEEDDFARDKYDLDYEDEFDFSITDHLKCGNKSNGSGNSDGNGNVNDKENGNRNANGISLWNELADDGDDGDGDGNSSSVNVNGISDSNFKNHSEDAVPQGECALPLNSPLKPPAVPIVEMTNPGSGTDDDDFDDEEDGVVDIFGLSQPVKQVEGGKMERFRMFN